MGLPVEVNNLMMGAVGGYQISRSLRFRSSASAYLNWTFGTPTNNKIWTYSLWVKRGKLGAEQELLNANSVNAQFYFSTSDTLNFYDATSGATYYSTQVFRDPSAWYHILVAEDTTQATAGNRVKIYVNGVQITSFSTGTAPTQNNASAFNAASTIHTIGRYNPTTTNYLDGYLAEVNFIDGQALTPSSFGETDSITGVWNPKKYSGTYGTNGFYLNFSDNSGATATTIGKDLSGNGNNWTPNNISVTAGTTYDSMLDSPTVSASSSNYCVMNPLNIYAVTPSNGNLTASGSNGGYRGTMAIPSSGKWYWETVVTTFATQVKYVGIGQNNSLGTGVRYESDNGQKVVDGTNSAYGATWAVNDVMGVAVDADASTVTFYKNNVSQGSISYTFLTNDAYVPVMTSGGTAGSDVIQANFGQRPFSYTPPSGYKALNTYNLPAASISNGAKHFAATTYTGTSATQNINNAVNGVSSQPDFVWIKTRSVSSGHVLIDSVRGTTAYLNSNTTNAENTSTDQFTSFNSNGFTLGANVLAGGNTNASGTTYVGWQWKAGGTGVTNNSGSITSTVSVNTTAGFSIVTWTGTGSNATIGHGLGVAPSMLINKFRSATSDWPVYHTSIGAGNVIYLNTTAASASSTASWNNTAPTSSVFSVGGAAAPNGTTMVTYCFAAVRGYSAFGSYTGNGSTDGPFIYTGFRPRWLLIRSTTAARDWLVYDTSRAPYNVMSEGPLQPNLSNTPYSGSYLNLDILSNGFKWRDGGSPNFNGSGETYIYAAFAENPFNLSRAR